MRVLRIVPLIVAVLLTTLFVVSYVKTVRWLLDSGLDTASKSFPGICHELRNDIDVVFWKPFPECKAWAHSGWELFRWADDPPEGTIIVLSFHSYYLLIPLSVFWGYAVFMICSDGKHHRPNKSLQATAAAPASCD